MYAVHSLICMTSFCKLIPDNDDDDDDDLTKPNVQEAIDKGAFRIRSGEVNEGSPNMINILRTATEIAGAMSYLHSLDILHSDLNGNNILLISNTGIDDRPFSVKVIPGPCIRGCPPPFPPSLAAPGVFPGLTESKRYLNVRHGGFQGRL